MDGTTSQLPVVVIGAGPVGLAAAAQLLERGLEPLVLEAGGEVGTAVRAWGHVRLFSPWEYDVDAAAVRLLDAQGWESPDRDALPTGADLVDAYLAPLAATPQLAGRIRTGTRVQAVSRQGVDKTRTVGREGRPYLVRTVREGRVEDVLARAVLDASGTWGRPNPLGAAGLPAVGEEQARAWLTGPLPDVLGGDRARFAGRHTLVVGTGHSAATTLLALVRLREEEPGTEVTWVIRGRSPARLYGAGDADGLPARGLLGSSLRAAVADGAVTLLREVTISALTPAPGGRLAVAGTGRDSAAVHLLVDSVVGATGFRPDLDVLREVRLDLDPGLEAPAALAPLIDPDFHLCGTVPPHGADLLAHPDEGLYVVGTKSYGRAPTFLLATGYEQVRSVAAALAGDTAAAARVELALPGTGVCSTDLGDREAAEVAGCGTGVGFATGSEHGRSAEGPAPALVASSSSSGG
ncbi:Predicted flavoprotein CzcO associated with the cation diffusion facilitator CzcD [Geodermatophilus amargosae]|uniref:Predicted flavoprotein CzcO associated with the cation diffusion facilitator CzcD n=1 Tax=Geodermatophilus amargosae TaxID=1296565 RepID=A0A1I6X6H3_9ACTN|nr:FAD-dependent oxidoreductase [Geodermatophilus amargosae]SFT33521.1 Predicted flavoprotein CzcO associated with the cation diffusion facilitator CzcD [Geodermatophilus amargosae]